MPIIGPTEMLLYRVCQHKRDNYWAYWDACYTGRFTLDMAILGPTEMLLYRCVNVYVIITEPSEMLLYSVCYLRLTII